MMGNGEKDLWAEIVDLAQRIARDAPKVVDCIEGLDPEWTLAQKACLALGYVEALAEQNPGEREALSMLVDRLQIRIRALDGGREDLS
jgi:hypothetical protein